MPVKYVVEPSLKVKIVNSCLPSMAVYGRSNLRNSLVFDLSLETCGFSGRAGEGNARLFFPEADREVEQ